MATINTNVWGDSTDWDDVAVYDQTLAAIQKCEQTDEVIDLWQNTKLIVDTPWDKSLSYCGLGTESPLSNIKFLRRVVPYFIYPENWDGSKFDELVVSYDEEDVRSVTNFAIGSTEVYSNKNQYMCQFKSDNGYLNLEQYGPRFQRWGPLSRADEAMQWIIDHEQPGSSPDPWCNVASSKMYTQIPVKNMVAIPYITCVNSIATKRLPNNGDLAVVDLATYLTEEQDEQHPHASYLTHPYILQVCLRFVQSGNLNDFNNYERDIILSPSTCFILDETNMYSDINPDCKADDEEGYNFSTAYMYNQLMNWFGSTNTGMPILGLTSIPGDWHWRDGWPISFGPSDIYQYGDTLPDLKDVTGRYNFPIWIGSEYLEEHAIMNDNPSTAYEATDGAYVYYMSAGNDPAELREKIRRAVACFGLFFVDGYEDKDIALDDNHMMLGILENGVGHGEYSFGLNNRLQDQWKWDDMHENEYDPSSEPEDEETDGTGTPILPSTPGFTLAGRGSACYAMTKLDIDEVMEDIFGATDAKYSEMVKRLEMFGSNPMNAIISCKWYPFTFSSNENSPVMLGSMWVNRAHQYNVLTSVANSFKNFSGSVKIKCPQNFVYSRHTTARLWLPFYGFYELPMNMLMSYTLQIEFHYNLPDDLAVWIISFGSKIYDFVECDPSIDVPLAGDNAAAIALAQRSKAWNIAASLGSAAVGTAMALGGNIMGLAVAGQGVINAVNQAGIVAANGPVGAPGSASFAQYAAANNNLQKAMSNYNLQKAVTVASSAGAVTGNALTAGNNITNAKQQAAREIGTLRTNVPCHSAAGTTTFLNLPLYPYVQIYTHDTLSDYKESEYKLKVGIACDKWVKPTEMPENSLLKATGVANMATGGMEPTEIDELNAILQSGFYR